MGRRRKGVRLELAGYAAGDMPVVRNVFRFTETYGLPLDVLLYSIEERGWMVSWIDYYAEATAAGMKHDRVLARIAEAVVDIWGAAFRDTVVIRLEALSGQEERVDGD